MLRAIDLRGALAINVITMVGIGPLITVPLVVAALHEHALVAWLLGALLAACDGLVYAELGSLYPGEGGTYVYLREGFGAEGAGRFVAFLFIWQFVLSTPLIVASGYIGFASYAAYLFPALAAHPLAQPLLACAVGVATIALLYRALPAVVRIALGFGVVALATLAIVALAGFSHATAAPAPATPFAAGALGGALVITLYDYLGYGEICALGAEILRPQRTIPAATLGAIAIVAALYVALQLGILHTLGWPEAARSTYVASLAVERAWGAPAALATTILILVTAFASTYGLVLGSSRIPYAAATTGLFFSSFARLHPRGRFPHVSLLAIGLLALPAAFFPLDQVIAALTAGLVIVQSLAQIGALALVRGRGLRAPFRMWLYPLPALLAVAGWLYVFASAGRIAIAFGLGTLGAGIVAYAVRAKRRLEWPFAARAAGLAVALLATLGAVRAGAAPSARATAFDASAIVQRDGRPVFTVHGKPFFVYGAAFFYERLPRDRWRASLEQLRALGINTIDLYVPWNWHELADGDFDFTGRTNPRRDLRTVLRLIRELGFYAIVRPGPVIRNEWRNGGYPAWLLARPEYAMPRHDLLEGRYPPIATLQNARSDDAAAAWLANRTHLRYAARWLRRVLHEIAPYGDRVIAIALDDDQGAYLDNQTWPAPHLRRYLRTLAAIVRSVTGPHVPLFINTYEMKVTASSPVWAMGNWYQSDALAIGEHDRSELELATGMLQTQPHEPIMLSEFQAGWLTPPDDVRARQTDPSNTTLALHTLLQLGARGVVNFPAQDTLYPAGMEVPFANAFYAWEAALGLDLRHGARYAPTRDFGALVSAFGGLLAQTHRVADAAIVYATSAYPPAALTNDDVFAIAAQTQAAQRACRLHGRACDLVDLRYADAATLRRYRVLLVPRAAFARTRRLAFVPLARARLAAFARAGGTVVAYDGASPPDAAWRAIGRPAVDGVDGVLQRGGGFAFLDAIDYAAHPVRAGGASVALGGRRVALPPFTVPARGALLIPLGLPLRALDRRFAAGDTLALATCPIRGVAAAGRALRVTLGPPPAPCALRLRIRGRAVARTFARAAVVAISPDGTLALAPVPRERAPGLPNANAALPVRPDALLATRALRRVPPGRALAYRADVYGDGAPALVLDNGLVRAVVDPDAGARGFVFEDDRTHANVFTSVGAMRDDVTVQPPPSTSDRLGAWTHAFPAGTFNRPYATSGLASGAIARARVAYDAPDVVPHGARFARTLALAAGARSFDADVRFALDAPANGLDQRPVSTTSLAIGDALHAGSWTVLTPDPQPFRPGATWSLGTGGALGFYDRATGELATLAWRPNEVAGVAVTAKAFSLLVRVTFAGGGGRLSYGLVYARSERDACKRVIAAAWANRRTGRGSGGTGLRSRLKSDRVKTLVGSNPTFPKVAHG